jgi:hypothetical protein
MPQLSFAVANSRAAARRSSFVANGHPPPKIKGRAAKHLAGANLRVQPARCAEQRFEKRLVMFDRGLGLALPRLTGFQCRENLSAIGWVAQFGIKCSRRRKGSLMDKGSQSEFVESTAGQVAAELERLGVPASQPVLIAIGPDDWLAKARAFSRPLVEAEGWTDADIDRLIDEERDAVHVRS